MIDSQYTIQAVQGLRYQSLLPSHREGLCEVLAQTLKESSAVQAFFAKLSAQNIELSQLGGRVRVIHSEGEQDFPGTPALLQTLQKVDMYRRHLGKESVGRPVEDMLTQAKAAKARQKSIVDGLEIVGDVTGCCRANMKLVAPEADWLGDFRNVGFGVGALWAGVGAYECWEGVEERSHALKIKDAEGVVRADEKSLRGALASYGGLFYLGDKLAQIFSSPGVEVAGNVLVGLSASFFGVSALIRLGFSYAGWRRCSAFRSELQEYLKNESIDEERRYRSVVAYLRELATTLSPEEVRTGVSLEAKQQYLKRRTSLKSLQLILKQSEELLRELDSPDEATRKKGLEGAQKLIQTVLWENRKKMALYVLGMLMAAITVSALILGTFFSFGLMPLILYIVVATLSMMVGMFSIGDWVAEKVKNPTSSI